MENTLFSAVEKRLNQFANQDRGNSLADSLIGLEKESLRVSPRGQISQQPHPKDLGSPLTHPFITTDYSEALLECITPPMTDKKAVLQFLQDIHVFVYNTLGEDFIWATSMPCVLDGDKSIPIASYGNSNQGMMKTVYRRGLGYRYGRVMQVIAGVHYNYSFAEAFWQNYQLCLGDSRSDFRSEHYFHMIRNVQRFGWIIPYLFGASPAVCKSFMGGKSTDMASFDASTYFEPYATSLRMGDIGYQNNKETCVGVKACYDSLQTYVSSLDKATRTPCQEYENIGVKVDGEYRQLNTNLLQIENEYYSTVRPKQITGAYEKVSLALKHRGVQYVELRSLDVNAFDPLGIHEDQLYFLEAFMLFCLWADSPLIDKQEMEEIDLNQSLAAHQGREPALELRIGGQNKTLQAWLYDIFCHMEGICGYLDTVHDCQRYSQVLGRLKHLVGDPGLTPAAQILREMRENRESSYHFALRKSMQHQDYFRSLGLSPERLAFFQNQAKASWLAQAQIEEEPQIPFDQYLARYFAQS